MLHFVGENHRLEYFDQIEILENMRLWFTDRTSNKLKVQDVCMGKLRRIFTTMKVEANDEFLYAGTMSGDVVKIKLNCTREIDGSFGSAPILVGCYGRHNSKRVVGKDCEKYMNGIRDIEIDEENSQLLIGAGDGTIELVCERNVQFRNYPSPTWPMLKAVKAAIDLKLSH